MAEIAKPPTLSEQYLLKGDEGKADVSTKPAPEIDVKSSVIAPPEEVAAPTTEDAPVVVESNEAVPDTVEESSGDSETTAEETKEVTPSASEDVTETPAAAEESSESAEPENSDDQEAAEEKPEIKLETAPADFRFPTTNQSRHCFTRYIEYHRCVAAKGEDAPECDKFAKYYRSLCPGEWVDRWNEQRENGTFPGPL